MKRAFKILPICILAIPTFYFCASENLKNYSLYVWGSGRNGELGLGIQSNIYSPTLMQHFNFIDISAKKAISAGITSQGKIYTWGKSKNGILGHDTTNTNILIPTQVEIDGQFKQVSCGYRHMCAVNIDGDVYMWGNFTQGQGGFRQISTKETERSKMEIKPKKIQGLKNIKHVACSGQHTIALGQNGIAYTWGNKKRIGRQGDENKPIQLNLKGIKKVDCGIDFSIALDQKGKIYTWGNNGFGQLGIPTVKNLNQPRLVQFLAKQQITDISCGDNYVGAISKNGKMYTWGFGNQGQLGHGDKSDQQIPRIMNFPDPIVKVACGSGHTAILSNKNELYVFGRGRQGQIGRQQKDESSSSYSLKPKLVESLRNRIIFKIVCGGSHTFALVK